MTGQPEFEMDYEFYALGVLDAGDKTEFEAQLAVSAELRAKLAAARSRLALLALAAPMWRLLRKSAQASWSHSKRAAPSDLKAPGPSGAADSGLSCGRQRGR